MNQLAAKLGVERQLIVDDDEPLNDADALEEMVMKIVRRPEAVFVEEESRPGGATLWIHVAEEDRGRVIGSQGAHINAIRSFWAVVGAQQGKRFRIEIAGGRRRSRAA